MKVIETKITCLKISEIENLDPVTVFFEDMAPRKGKITIECYGKSWSAYWGGMGDRTVSQFFISCDNCYLIGKLDPQCRSTVTDYENLDTQFKKRLIQHRKEGLFSKEEAREWWDEIEFYCENHEGWLHTSKANEIASNIIGDDWWHDLPKIENHHYVYLSRIVDATKEGIKTND